MSKWEKVKLGDAATYINGYAFKPDQWTDNGLPIIRIQNLNNEDALFNYCNYSAFIKKLWTRTQLCDTVVSWRRRECSYNQK